MAVLLNTMFFQRNPRYLLLLATFLISSSLLLIFPWQESPIPQQITSTFMDYFPAKFRGSTSLERFIQNEEEEYQLVLAGRQQMINYYGPDPKEIQSWPPGNVFYVLWDFYIAAFNCPHRIQRVGNLGDGGKWLCGVERIAAQRKPCNVYSFGVNHDSSFEAAFLQRAPSCQIWGYDFSVHEWGPQIQTVPEFLEASHFFPYKAAAEDKPHLSPPEYTIQTLMQQNGHDFIDLLKIDIEGGEFSVLESFLRPYIGPDAPPLPVGQMEIEIHAWGAYTNFDVFNPWWEMLEKAGFRPFWTEANLPKVSHTKTLPDTTEYSFINIKGRHALISEYY